MCKTNSFCCQHMFVPTLPNGNQNAYDFYIYDVHGGFFMKNTNYVLQNEFPLIREMSTIGLQKLCLPENEKNLYNGIMLEAKQHKNL